MDIRPANMMYVAEKQSEEVGNLRGLLLQKSYEKKRNRKVLEDERKKRNNDVEKLSRVLKRIDDLEKKLGLCEAEIKETKQNFKSKTKQKMDAQRELDAQRWKEETAKLALQAFKDKSQQEEKKHSTLAKQMEKMDAYIGQSNANSVADKSEIDLKLHHLIDLRHKKDALRQRCVENEIKFLSTQERNKDSKLQLKEILSELVLLREENSHLKVECEDVKSSVGEINSQTSELTRERDELLAAICMQENAVKQKKRDLRDEKSRADLKMLELQDIQSRLEQLQMEWQLSLHNHLDPVTSSS